jgi:citrate lyase subunit beta / citryl-CoA lyase
MDRAPIMSTQKVRSALYIPAHQFLNVVNRLVDRPDAAIIDLEDSVPVDHKLAARSNLAVVASQVRRWSDIFALRINALDAGFQVDDFDALLNAAPDVVVLPKADAFCTAQLSSYLHQVGLEAAIWPMIESPEAVDTVPDIVGASSRVTRVMLGAVDLAKAVHVELDHLDAGLLAQRTKVASISRQCGVEALDGIFLGPDQELQGSLSESRRLGFSGRSLARPGQIGLTNRTFDQKEC